MTYDYMKYANLANHTDQSKEHTPLKEKKKLNIE